MPFANNPGCSCCVTCNVVELQDLDHDLVAGTPYQLPGNINSFNQINLSNLIETGFFKTKDDWIDLKVYRDVGGVETLQGTIRYQLMSLGHSRDYHYRDDTLPYPTIRKWRGLGARVDNEWHLIHGDSYNVNVGCSEVVITGVSAGTFDGTPCVVSSLKNAYGRKYGTPNSTETGWTFDPDDRPFRGNRWEQTCPNGQYNAANYRFEKNNYIMFDNESSFATTLYRYDSTSDSVTLEVTALGTASDATFAAGATSAAISRTFSGSAGTITTTNTTGPLALDIPHNIESESSSTVSGPGDFKIECTRAYTTESGSVDIRIVRTGGNTDAVNVSVYDGSTTQTLAFSAGQNFATITVNGTTHDGLRSSLNLDSDATPPTPKDDYLLEPITIRANSWELHGEATAVGTTPNLGSNWLSQKHSTAQDRYFYYADSIPFDKTGSVWQPNVYIKVDASKNTKLRYYELTKIRNDATCDYADEHEKTCPLYEQCTYTSEHNHQPADFADTSLTGTMYLPDAEKHVFIDGCTTHHLFRDVGLDYEEPFFVFREHERRDNYVCTPNAFGYCVFVVEDYTPPSNTSSGPFTQDCDGTTITYNVINDYSNLPSGYIHFDSVNSVVGIDCVGYVGTALRNVFYVSTGSGVPGGAANLTGLGISRCAEWDYDYGDVTYTYTTDSSSPLNEFLVRIISDVVIGHDFTPPADTSDTTYEFVHSGGFGKFKGIVFRWNGTDYDMIGQERIYTGDWSVLNTSAAQDQDMIDRITEPHWYYNSNAYYYIKPNNGGNLSWEGPFSTPVDTTVSPSINVEFAGRKRVTVKLHASGTTSNWIGMQLRDVAGGASTKPSYVGEVAGAYRVTDTGTDDSPIDYYEWQYFIGNCGNSPPNPCVGSTPCVSMLSDPENFPFWGQKWSSTLNNQQTTAYERLRNDPQIYFPYGDYDTCGCLNETWEKATTASDRNELMNPPSDAASCNYATCLPDLNPNSKTFPYDTIDNHLVFPNLPLSTTTNNFSVTVGSSPGTGNICDCGTGTSGFPVTNEYYQFDENNPWDGSLNIQSSQSGSTHGILHAVTTDELKGTLFRYGFGSIDHYRGSQDTDNVLFPDFAEYTKFTPCWSDDNHPTLSFTESDCDVQSTDDDRQWRFVSGYTLTTPTVEDYTGTVDDIDFTVLGTGGVSHRPVPFDAFGQVNTPCYKVHRWQGIEQNFIDIHPRYLEFDVKAFATSWPK